MGSRFWFRPAAGLLLIMLPFVSACTSLSEEDSARVTTAGATASEAREIAEEALTLARQASQDAKRAAEAARSAAQAAEKSAAAAAAANERADRMFKKTLRK